MTTEAMKTRSAPIGNIGIVVGAVALILALVHFWAGPFAPQPTIETVVADKISSIRTAAIDAIKGKEPVTEVSSYDWDADLIANVTTAVLGGLALILGVVSIAKSESNRVAGGAIALGAGAIAFQFIAMYVMAILVVILILGIISQLGIGIG